jgi:Flp pilus assembly pilin Flp
VGVAIWTVTRSFVAKYEGLMNAEETALSNVMYRLIWEEQAQDLIEYALLSACLAVACIAGILEISRIVEFFAAVGAALDNAI